MGNMNYEEAYQEAKASIQSRFIDSVLSRVSSALIDRCNTWYFKNGLIKAKCKASGELSIRGTFSDDEATFVVIYKGCEKTVPLNSNNDDEVALEILSHVLGLLENPNSGIFSASNYKTAPPRPSSKHIYSKLR